MATEFTFSTTDPDFTLDETSGIQNGADGTPSGSARSDSDVALAILQAQATTFYDYLFTASGLNLSSAFPTDIGVATSASDLINVTSDTAISSLGLTDADGDAFDGTQSSGLFTTSGEEIFLVSDSVDGVANRVVLGKYDSDNNGSLDAVAYAVFLQPDGPIDGDIDVKLWSVTFTPLDNPVEGSTSAAYDDALDLLSQVYITTTGTKEFNFNDLPAGQNLFGMVGDASDAIVVTGQLPVLKSDGTWDNASDTINTSKAQGEDVVIGVDNQSFDPAGGGNPVNDGAYFTYVENPDTRYLAGAPGGLTQNEADDADNVLFGNTKEVDGAFLKIAQVTGNGKASLSLTAYDLTNDTQDGRPFVQNQGSLGGAKVNIDEVYVYSATPFGAGTLVESFSGGAEGGESAAVTISITNGVASLTGLDDNMYVVWHTDGDHDQVLVQTSTGSTPFDIGLFGLLDGQVNSASLAGRAFLEDGGPSFSAPIADSTVKYETGANGTVTKPLNGVVGTDDPGTYEITAFTASFTYLGITVEGAINTDKTEVKYFQDKNNNDTFDGDDVLYYTLALTEPGGVPSYTFTVNNAPSPPPLEFDFAGLPSGQNLFGMVADTGAPNGPGVLFFSSSADINDPGNGTMTNASGTINTSKGGGPITVGTNNQMIDPGEGIFWTILNDPDDRYLANVSGGLNQNEADDADNMLYGSLKEVGGAFLKIAQTQGNAVEAASVEAFDITSSGGRDLLAASGQNHVDIVKLSVYNGSVDPANLLETTTPGGADGGMSDAISVSIVDGIAEIIGLESGYVIAWETDDPNTGTVEDHDQVLLTGLAGKFDIGAFGLLEAQQVPDHFLDFTVGLTDGDNDTVSDSFRINIDAFPFI